MLFICSTQIFVTGDNRQNQLGIEQKSIIEQITALNFDFDSLSQGESQTAFLVKDQLYGTGISTDYQLGTSKPLSFTKPTKIDFFENIKLKQIALSNKHFVALTADGMVYTSGLNHKQQLGQARTADVASPNLIAFNERAKFVAAVQDLTYVVTLKSKLYVVGECVKGLCGSLKDGIYPSFTMIPFDGPIDNVKSLTSALLIESKKEYFTLGSDEFGQFCQLKPNQAKLASVGKNYQDVKGNNKTMLYFSYNQLWFCGRDMLSKEKSTHYQQKISFEHDVIDAQVVRDALMVISSKGVFAAGKAELGNVGKSGEFYGKFEKIADYQNGMQRIVSSGYSTFILPSCADHQKLDAGKCVSKYQAITTERSWMIAVFTIAIVALVAMAVIVFRKVKQQNKIEHEIE